MPSSKPIAEAQARVGKGYDRVATFYDRVVQLVFGDRINAIQCNAIDAIPDVEHVAIIGGGSGQLLSHVLDRGNCNWISYAEASDRMRAKALARLSPQETAKVTFMRSASGLAEVDAIVLPFVLDCYTTNEIVLWLQDLRTRLKPGGQLIIIDFNHDASYGFHGGLLQRLFVHLLYLFFYLSGGSTTLHLPRIFSLAEEGISTSQSLASDLRGWLLARSYQIDSK